MPWYRYRAYDAHGALQAGEIEAATRDSALDALCRNGLYPLEANAGRAGDRQRWWERQVLRRGRLSRAGLSLLTRELATLLKVEIPVDEALRIVSLQPAVSGPTRRICRALLESVLGGASLSEAMRAHPDSFPEFYWRMVHAGEVSGTVGQVMDDLASFLERSAETRARIRVALLYPAVVGLAAAVALAVIFTVLLPTIVPMFKDAGITPPVIVRLLLDVQETIARDWILLLATASALLVGSRLAAQNDRLREVRDRSLLRLPTVGGLLLGAATARFARMLATLLRSGVPMLQALRIVGSVAGNHAFAAAIAKAADEIQEGGTLHGSLTKLDLFSDLSLRLVTAGEQTGQLETMLLRVATIYEAQLQRQIDRLTSLLVPVLTLAIGIVVGGLILSVMSAIVSVNELAFQ
jgi:general secretion pathway protein F